MYLSYIKIFEYNICTNAFVQVFILNISKINDCSIGWRRLSRKTLTVMNSEMLFK